MDQTDPLSAPMTVATLIAGAACEGRAPSPIVRCFFDPETSTASYVVHDAESRGAAIIDSVLDYDPASGATTTRSAERILAYVTARSLRVEWLLETHVHADHLSAAPWLQRRTGGRLAIGRGVMPVQRHFGDVFHVGADFATDGSQFDHLLDDGETFAIGDCAAIALAVPGHTSADMAYLIGDALFVGDTLFMPDGGTARADFPGGDAGQLFRSIRRLLTLPGQTRMFVCHDYRPGGRADFAWQTSVAEQRAHNIHVRDGVSEAEFVAMRDARDATLPTPRLMLPSVQVNMRAGHPPAPEADGRRYLKIPFGGDIPW